jgi:DNA-directed RNA polymerase sigma subunit (sigma70/sigma32)
MHWMASDDGSDGMDALPLLVQAAEDTLTLRSRSVFALRFGLTDGRGRTLAQVGEELESLASAYASC